MKRFVIFVLLCTMVGSTYGAKWLSVSNPQSTPQTITLNPDPTPKPPTSTTKPRSLVESDIEGYYYGGVATFIFNRDLGDADIVVSNLTTGEQWHNSLSGIGSTSVVLSGDSGNYDVAIYTDNGDYYGYFTL